MPVEPSDPSVTIVDLIAAAAVRDGNATPALFESLYAELHRVASRQLRRGPPDGAVGPTTLLHECYLGLADRQIDFADRARFIGYAARAMRGLIVDEIRKGRALRHGGAFHLTSLDTQVSDQHGSDVSEVTRLHDALVELQAIDASLAELVDLKFFCGFGFVDIAAMRGVSERTVQRDWQKARLVLHGALKDD